MRTKSPAVKGANGKASELRRQLKMLRAYDAQCRALFELMPISVVLLDARGVVRDANPSFCRNIGFPRNEIVGSHVSKFAQESRVVIKKNLKRLLAGEQLDHEVTNVQKDGSLRFNDNKVTEAELTQKVKEAVAADPEMSLVVSADKEVQHGNVVHMLDIAKLAGVTKFAINVMQQSGE